jgi:hypothetical protein
MEDFDWIKEYEVIPDLDNNMSFDGVKLIVPRGLVLVKYNGVTHLEFLPSKAKQTKLSVFLREKFYEGRRVHIPLFPKMELEVVEKKYHTTVKFYWCGIKRLFCFELPMSNVKDLYKNNAIRLTTQKNTIL